MAFEIGERVATNFTGPGTIVGPMEKDEDGEAFQLVKFDSPLFGEKRHRISKLFPYTDPKPAKETPVQQLLKKDPEAVALFAQAFLTGGRIVISSSPDSVDSIVESISSNTRLKPSEAADYVRVVTDRTHHAKFDILVTDPEAGLSAIADRIGVYLHRNGRRARKGEVEFHSRELAEHLMSKYEVLPQIQTGGGDGAKA